MNRLSCHLERISDFGLGLILLIIGSIFTLIGFTVVPVIGLIVAIPMLVLAVSFLGAKKSKECALLSSKARKILSDD